MKPASVDPPAADQPGIPDGEYQSARKGAWNRAALAWADARAEGDPQRRSALVDKARVHDKAWTSEGTRLDEDEASQVDAAP